MLRLPWIETHLVLPLTQGQAVVAGQVFGAAAVPIAATLACSGTDAIALCLGAILAYPATWRSRLSGSAVGVTLILALNTIRIGTLGRLAANPDWFNALHLYVWPAVLTIAIAGYVFAWMRFADRAPSRTAASGRSYASWRFIGLSVTFLLVFALAAPLYLANSGVLAVAGFIARAAAAILNAAGVTAHAAGNTLLTSHGGFLVTGECIVTPLIPVFLAAVIACATSWRWLILGLTAAVPLFIVLGIARLLVVVLPVAAASPEFFVHAFFQLLTGIVLVILAAVWRDRGRSAAPHAVAGIVSGALCIMALGPWSARLIASPAVPFNDPQGAIALLPAFQVGLFGAIWVAAFLASGWRRFLTGLAALVLLQAAGLAVLHVLTTQAGLTAHVREVRGWAVAGPLLIVAAVTNFGRARR